MSGVLQTRVRDAIRAMEAAEPSRAAEAIRGLEGALRQKRSSGVPDFKGAWDAFLRLLFRRGFFTSTSEEMRESLKEIREVGDGFDLYELAKAMARCDVTLLECLGRAKARFFPELAPFCEKCDCLRHGGP